MGMYTEIYVKATFPKDTPKEVIEVIKYMMGQSETNPESLPDHPLFGDTRWRYMLQCSSYYHVPKSVGEFWHDHISNGWYLVSRSDLKNYDNEIEHFFNWISPYVEKSNEKTFIGYSLYEENNEPTLYYVE